MGCQASSRVPRAAMAAASGAHSRYSRLGRDKLGEGAYGLVYPAWDSQGQRLVAIKVQRRDSAEAGDRPLFSLPALTSARRNVRPINIGTNLDSIDSRKNIRRNLASQGSPLEQSPVRHSLEINTSPSGF